MPAVDKMLLLAKCAGSAIGAGELQLGVAARRGFEVDAAVVGDVAAYVYCGARVDRDRFTV